jgi:hypothetical protein
MDEHLGRRTVGGLLFTKGGSILLFRDDGSRHKANNCCSRHGCSSRHSHDRGKGKEPRRAAVSNESTPATPRRSQNPSRKPPPPSQPHESSASDSVSRDAGSPGSETGSRSRDAPGRDLLARLKERVNASRKRSLARENSPSSSPSSNGLSANSSPCSRSVSRPSHRAASRIRKADEGPSAGSDSARRNGATRGVRRNSQRNDDDLLLAEQIARDHEPAAEGSLSGFMARYRSGLQGALSSLEDTMEDSNGYWRFDMGGTEEVTIQLLLLV